MSGRGVEDDLESANARVASPKATLHVATHRRSFGKLFDTCITFLTLTALASDEECHDADKSSATDDGPRNLLTSNNCCSGNDQSTQGDGEAAPKSIPAAPYAMPDGLQLELVPMGLLGFKRCQQSLGHARHNSVV